MKSKLWLVITVYSIGLGSCSSNKNLKSEMPEALSSMSKAETGSVTDSIGLNANYGKEKHFNRILLRNISINGVCKSVKNLSTSLENKTIELGGFVTESNMIVDIIQEKRVEKEDSIEIFMEFVEQATMELKVPAESISEFNQLLNEGLIRVTSKNYNTNDVTEIIEGEKKIHNISSNNRGEQYSNEVEKIEAEGDYKTKLHNSKFIMLQCKLTSENLITKHVTANYAMNESLVAKLKHSFLSLISSLQDLIIFGIQNLILIGICILLWHFKLKQWMKNKWSSKIK